MEPLELCFKVAEETPPTPHTTQPTNNKTTPQKGDQGSGISVPFPGHPHPRTPPPDPQPSVPAAVDLNSDGHHTVHVPEEPNGLPKLLIG